MFTYKRVIPRDLFNEAGLLKAMGRVVVLLDKTPGHNAKIFPEEVFYFDIVQDKSSGNIHVHNLKFTVSGREWILERTLNNRRSWSLEARTTDYEECVEVFTEKGNFTPEMLELIRG